MNIFASRQHELDYYIGKDIWVKFGMLDGDGNEEFKYIKFLGKRTNRFSNILYQVYEIPADIVENPEATANASYYEWGPHSLGKLIWDAEYFEDELVLSDPVEAATGEEVREAYQIVEDIMNGG